MIRRFRPNHSRPYESAGRLFALAALAALVPGVLAGCASSPPYVPYTDTASRRDQADAFSVRYSVDNTPEEIAALIAEKCGEEHDTARIFRQPYLGTLLHIHQAWVSCGDDPIGSGQLVRLR